MNKNNYAAITYNQTTDYHTNGNYGLIASCSKDEFRPFLRTWFEPVSNLIGETISFSCDVKSLNDPLTVTVYQYDGSTYSSSRINVPANTESRYVVTTTVANTTIALWLGIEFQQRVNTGNNFYTDNWKLFLHDS